MRDETHDSPTSEPRRRWWRLARHELALMAILGIAAGGLLAFVELAELAREDAVHSLDRSLLLALREPADLADPVGPGWFEEAARDFTALGSLGVLTLVTLAVMGYLLVIRRAASALLVAIAIGGGTLVSTVLKAFFDRARPDLVPHQMEVYTASFPSGHSMLAAVAYLTLGAMLMRLQDGWRAKAYVLGVAVAITVLVGASRVYLGVHWPSDVLAGWSLGAAWAMGCWGVTLWLQRRRRVAPDAEAIAVDRDAPVHERPGARHPLPHLRDAACDDVVRPPTALAVRAEARERAAQR